jgi:chloride channel 7
MPGPTDISNQFVVGPGTERGSCVQPVPWRCPQGEHNDLATALYGSGDQLLARLFAVGNRQAGATDSAPGLTPRSLALFAVSYMPMMAVAAGMCVPAGMFMPSLLLGGAAGLAAGLELQARLPTWPIQPGARICRLLTALLLLGICCKMA